MAYLTLSPEPASRARKSIDDYEFLAGEGPKGFSTELGKGAYGSVRRVRDKQTGEICAMKIMSKKSIMQFATKENLKREISIQRSIFHPNIIKLFHHFEDDENVYLVLEYAANGSLFHHLRKTRKFTEEQAFIFFLQTCLGIDYLHKRKILHRDLKPENLLLDKDYNIKLCDFGWSAENQSKRVTFCGTVDYMAPEMLKSKPYDHKLDIWCLGILLYELLHGVAPFKGKSDREKVDNIVKNQTINFGPDISPEAVDLVKRILRPVPTERLSMDEILRHPWMKKYERVYGTNIQGLQRQQDDLIREYQMSLGRQETGDYIGAAIYDNIYLLNYDENADYKQQFASGSDYQHLANKIPMYNSQTGGNYGMNYNSQPYGLSDNYSGLGGQNQYASGYKSYDPLSPTDKYNQSPYQTNAYKYNEYGGKSFEYGSLHTSEKEKKSGNLSANQGRRRSPSEEYEEARNYGVRKSQMGRRRKSADQPGLWTRILMGLGCIEREKEGGKTH